MLKNYLRPLVSCALPALIAVSANAQIVGFTGQVLEIEPPDREFATSDEHYRYLLDKADGGTQHTWDTLPRWDGLWDTAGNNHMDAFIEGGLRGGTVKKGS